MSRTESQWDTTNGGTAIKTINPAGYDILINGTSKYLNFNTTIGSSGYGFRDNAGVMEFKDSGGSWTPFSSGGGGGVSSFNGLTGAVVLAAGSGISLTPVGNTITIAATGGGSGDVIKVGTPANNQLGIWTGDGTIEGDVDLTFDTATNTLGVGLVGLDGRVQVHAVKSDSSDGLLIESSTGTDVGVLGVGNTANVTWYGSHNYDTATQDTIAGFTGTGKTLGSLATATYPSLTELSYVKGVTSAIQTQLNGKQATITFGSGVQTFLATPTSANLLAAVTDETGSGSLVFATSPTLVTPTLGVATATSVNKVAITAPATSATLTIADGKTLTASNTITLTGTDGVSMNVSNNKIAQISIGISGGGAAVPNNSSSDAYPVAFAGTITAYTITVTGTGTCTVQVWKKATGTAVPTVSDKITTSGLSLSSGTAIRSTTLSDFTTTTITANDIFIVNVTAVSGVIGIVLTLEITKS